MPLAALAFYDYFDQQHRKFTVEFYVPAPADLGAGVDLPTQAHLLAVHNALVAATGVGFSTARLLNYGVKVVQTDLTGANTGDGSIPIISQFHLRSGVNEFGRTDPFGDLEGIPFKIPSADEASITFDPRNRNAISTTSTLFTALRTALVNVGYTDVDGDTFSPTNLLQDGTYFTGKRAPMRPR